MSGEGKCSWRGGTSNLSCERLVCLLDDGSETSTGMRMQSSERFAYEFGG